MPMPLLGREFEIMPDKICEQLAKKFDDQTDLFRRIMLAIHQNGHLSFSLEDRLHLLLERKVL